MEPSLCGRTVLGVRLLELIATERKGREAVGWQKGGIPTVRYGFMGTNY